MHLALKRHDGQGVTDADPEGSVAWQHVVADAILIIEGLDIFNA